MDLLESQKMRFSFPTLHVSYAPSEINFKNISITCDVVIYYNLFYLQ